MKITEKLFLTTAVIIMIIALTGFVISTRDLVTNINDERNETADTYVPDIEDIEHEITYDENIEVLNAIVDPSPTPEYMEYTVKAGDSFWKISEDHYGDGSMYTSILAYNEMDFNDVIHPGDVIKIANYDIAINEVSEVQTYEEITQEVVETTPTPVSNTSYGLTSFNGDMSVTEAVAIIKDQPDLDTTGMTYMGNWKITGYDPHCDHCCGKHDGITASGNQAEFGVSVGCNNLPLGTKIYIEGYGVFRVDDRGGMSKNHIDIAAPSHDACYQMTGNANVYVISYP